jgi:hypothetical protein
MLLRTAAKESNKSAHFRARKTCLCFHISFRFFICFTEKHRCNKQEIIISLITEIIFSHKEADKHINFGVTVLSFTVNALYLHYKENQLIWHTETITAYCKNYIKHTNTFGGQNTDTFLATTCSTHSSCCGLNGGYFQF